MVYKKCMFCVYAWKKLDTFSKLTTYIYYFPQASSLDFNTVIFVINYSGKGQTFNN